LGQKPPSAHDERTGKSYDTGGNNENMPTTCARWAGNRLYHADLRQQKDMIDPQIIEQLHALSKKTNEAWNNNDAALAALYTEDAVPVTDTDPIYGRDDRGWISLHQL
jgi:hypothetical protein